MMHQLVFLLCVLKAQHIAVIPHNAPVPALFSPTAMLLDTRDTIPSVPAAEVPSWLSVNDMAIKIESFLATLIVYDSGKHHIYV